MKKILILILLSCFSNVANAQLPELGWSRGQVEKFMVGKYKYRVTDPSASKAASGSFAPVSFYGLYGTLWIGYDTLSKVSIAAWHRGGMAKVPTLAWTDTATWVLLDSKLTSTQILNLFDSISNKMGKPLFFSGDLNWEEQKNLNTRQFASYTWKVKEQEYNFWSKDSNSVVYMYSIQRKK